MSNVVPEIAAKLKKFNPEIGEYVSNVLNVQLNHLVRFSNGALEIPKYFYEEYETNPQLVTNEQLRILSMRFRKK